MCRVVSLVCVLCLGASAMLFAQEDFGSLKIKPGQVIYVTEPSGVETGGPVTKISAASLSIDGHDFVPVPGLKIERKGDPVWDGALMGAGIGAVLGIFIAAGECGVQLSKARCFAGSTAEVAGIGAFIDWRHTGRTKIFEGVAGRPTARWSVVPRFATGARSISLFLVF